MGKQQVGTCEAVHKLHSMLELLFHFGVVSCDGWWFEHGVWSAAKICKV
jgi:hypothetical protein